MFFIHPGFFKPRSSADRTAIHPQHTQNAEIALSHILYAYASHSTHANRYLFLLLFNPRHTRAHSSLDPEPIIPPTQRPNKPKQTRALAPTQQRIEHKNQRRNAATYLKFSRQIQNIVYICVYTEPRPSRAQ